MSRIHGVLSGGATGFYFWAPDHLKTVSEPRHMEGWLRCGRRGHSPGGRRAHAWGQAGHRLCWRSSLQSERVTRCFSFQPPHNPRLPSGEGVTLWVRPTWKGALYNCPYFPFLPQPCDTLPQFTSPRPGPPLTYPRTGDAPNLEVKVTTESGTGWAGPAAQPGWPHGSPRGTG